MYAGKLYSNSSQCEICLHCSRDVNIIKIYSVLFYYSANSPALRYTFKSTLHCLLHTYVVLSNNT